MIKLFFYQFIFIKYRFVTFWFILNSFFVFLSAGTSDDTVKLEDILFIKGVMTWMFVIPALFITIIDKKYFKLTNNTLINNYGNYCSTLMAKYYILSAFFLAIFFSLPVNIYGFYVNRLIFRSPEYYYPIIFLKFMSFISSLLFYICLFAHLKFLRPDKKLYFEFVLINFSMYSISFFIDWIIRKKFFDYFSFDNRLLRIISSDFTLILMFLMCALYIYNHYLISQFKEYAD